MAPYPPPGLSATNTLRGRTRQSGACLRRRSGILDDRFGFYRIQPVAPVTFSNAPNPRPTPPLRSAGWRLRFRLASANVLNFFVTLGSRGAQTAQELINQRTKVIAEAGRARAPTSTD